MLKTMLLVAAALLAATAARAEQAPAQPAAQPAPAAVAQAPDPVRLQLAREVLDATGGRAGAEKLLGLAFSSIARYTPSSSNPKTAEVVQGVLDDVKGEIMGMVPEMMDLQVNAFARVYSEQELRDYLGWLRSPSGQSFTRKAPLITQEILAAEMPILAAMRARFIPKLLDRICGQTECTAEERKRMENAASRAIAQSMP